MKPWISTLSLLLVGCPEPNPTPDLGSNAPVAAAGGPASSNAGSAADAPGPGPGATPVNGATTVAAGTIAAELPASELTPMFTQDQLTDGQLIRGTLACGDCTGKLLVRVLPPPPDEAGGAPEIQLVTMGVYDKPGAFEIRVPKDQTSVVLQVVDDANADGKPSAGERIGMSSGGPVVLGGAVPKVELTVGLFPQGQQTDGMGAPLDPANGGSAPTGAPPTGAPPTGAPPADGAATGAPAAAPAAQPSVPAQDAPPAVAE